MHVVKILLCLAAALVLSGCQAAKNKAADENAIIEYFDWRYENFPGQDGGVVHAAVTGAKAANAADANRLFASAVSQNCASIVLSLSVNDTGKTFAKDQRINGLQGEVRVDDLAPRQITYDYDTMNAKPRIFVSFGRILDNEALRKELQNGQMVRFTVTLEKQTRVFKFSLKNINGAMSALVNNCKESAAFQGSGKGKPAPLPSGKAPQGPPGKGANDDDKQFFK